MLLVLELLFGGLFGQHFAHRRWFVLVVGIAAHVHRSTERWPTKIVIIVVVLLGVAFWV